MIDKSLRSARRSLHRSGKTFAFAARFMPGRDADRCARLYAVCRAIDDLADRDGGAAAASRLARLRQLSWSDNARDPIASELVGLDRDVSLDRRPIDDLIDGVLQDFEPVHIASVDALLRYAYRVGGSVGLAMCDVLQVHEREARLHAIDLGIAMQLTNIARDVAEDARTGRRYLPEEWIDLEPDDIALPTRAERRRIAEATLKILDLADAYYASGAAGLRYVPLSARVAIAAAMEAYRAIGNVIRRRGADPAKGRAFVSTGRKAALALRAVAILLIPEKTRRDPRLHHPISGLVNRALRQPKDVSHAIA